MGGFLALGGAGGVKSAINPIIGGATNNGNFTAIGAPLQDPTTTGQATTAYGNTQSGLDQQQQLANALAAQGGINNQSSVYNQQQQLANALQMQAQGVGPNPAQDQFAQNTGANVASQAALMAGQRGVGANPGEIARQIAMQGAATQQQAAGQQATLQAQQQLAAQGQLQAQQQNLAGLATQQVGQQAGAVSGYNQFAQGQQQNLLNGIAQQNNSAVGTQSNINNANAGIAGINAQNTAKVFGGLANSAGGAAQALAKGGEVENPKLAAVAPKDRFSNNVMHPHLREIANIYHPEMMAAGGKVPVVVSPGERYLNPNEAKEVASGQKGVKEVGTKIPGKAAVKGDSLKNDKVPIKAEEGGVVIPRSKELSPEHQEEARKFVEALLKKHGDSGQEQDEFKSALKKAISSRKK